MYQEDFGSGEKGSLFLLCEQVKLSHSRSTSSLKEELAEDSGYSRRCSLCFGLLSLDLRSPLLG